MREGRGEGNKEEEFKIMECREAGRAVLARLHGKAGKTFSPHPQTPLYPHAWGVAHLVSRILSITTLRAP